MKIESIKTCLAILLTILNAFLLNVILSQHIGSWSTLVFLLPIVFVLAHTHWVPDNWVQITLWAPIISTGALICGFAYYYDENGVHSLDTLISRNLWMLGLLYLGTCMTAAALLHGSRRFWCIAALCVIVGTVCLVNRVSALLEYRDAYTMQKMGYQTSEVIRTDLSQQYVRLLHLYGMKSGALFLEHRQVKYRQELLVTDDRVATTICDAQQKLCLYFSYDLSLCCGILNATVGDSVIIPPTHEQFILFQELLQLGSQKACSMKMM